jgi:hypothetical protein
MHLPSPLYPSGAVAMLLLADLRNDRHPESSSLTLLEALFGEYIILGHGVCVPSCARHVLRVFIRIVTFTKNDISIEKDVSPVSVTVHC